MFWLGLGIGIIIGIAGVFIALAVSFTSNLRNWLGG